MGWRRDAEGTSKGRRVPLTRRDDLHDAEGTSKGLSLDAKGCPFRRRDCPFTRRDAPKGCPFTSKGFVRSFVSGPSRPDTHPQAPKRRAWEALTQTQSGIHSRMRGYSGQRGSLSLPAQMYRGWPAAAVARPFPLRSPASPYASVAPTTWCPSCPLYYHTLMHPAPVEPPPLPLLTTPVMVPCAASRLPASKGCPFTSMGHVEGMSLHNKGTLVMIDFRRYTPPESTLRALPARCTTVAVRTFAATIARVKREGMRRRDRLVTIF
jgi:hypothetical protein